MIVLGGIDGGVALALAGLPTPRPLEQAARAPAGVPVDPSVSPDRTAESGDGTPSSDPGRRGAGPPDVLPEDPATAVSISPRAAALAAAATSGAPLDLEVVVALARATLDAAFGGRLMAAEPPVPLGSPPAADRTAAPDPLIIFARQNSLSPSVVATDPDGWFTEPEQALVHRAFAQRAADVLSGPGVVGGLTRPAAYRIAVPDPMAIFLQLDRRALFAVASDIDGRFTEPEQALALRALARRAADVLSGLGLVGDGKPRAAALRAYAGYLDEAGPEERDSAEWRVERAAAGLAYERLAVAAGEAPEALDPADPVVVLVKDALRLASASAVTPDAPMVATPQGIRDMPILMTGFFSQEMLLAALLVALRAGGRPGARRVPRWRPRRIRPDGREPRLEDDDRPLFG